MDRSGLEGYRSKKPRRGWEPDLLGCGVSLLWISNVVDHDRYRFFVRHLERNMEHEIHTNRIPGKRADAATQLPWNR